MTPFRVTFHLDGSGVAYDPWEPLHLDALLTWVLAPRQGVPPCLCRDDPVVPVRLPLVSSLIGRARVHHASALLPLGPTGEDLTYWRKRFRQSRAELTAGSPNLTNGTFRDWNMPLPLLLVPALVAYGAGTARDVRKLLKDVRSLGKKRAHGHGKVIGIEVEASPADYSLVRDGRAQRWLPDPTGTRLVRPTPPYWHPQGRVRCCEVGAPVGTLCGAAS